MLREIKCLQNPPSEEKMPHEFYTEPICHACIKAFSDVPEIKEYRTHELILKKLFQKMNSYQPNGISIYHLKRQKKKYVVTFRCLIHLFFFLHSQLQTRGCEDILYMQVLLQVLQMLICSRAWWNSKRGVGNGFRKYFPNFFASLIDSLMAVVSVEMP